MCDAAMVPSEDATPVPHNGVILLESIRDLGCYSLVQGFTARKRKVGVGGL